MSQAAGAPDRSRCPLCGAPLPGPWCAACGVDLSGPLADELWWIDNQLHTLPQRRYEVVRLLREPAPPPPTTHPLPGLPPPPTSWVPPVAGPGAPGPAGVPAPPSGPQVSSILLALGVGLLVVAALVFAVVSWDRLGALGQAAVLVGLTAAAAWGTRAASRRGLSGTAEALGVLTVVMGPLLAQAVRITLDLPALDDRTWEHWVAWTWWPGVLAVVGVVAIWFGHRVGVRSSLYIGVVLVQAAVPAWLALAPLPVEAVAVGLALQAGVVAAGPTRRERAGFAAGLWSLGAVVVWCLAMAVAVGSAGDADLGAPARWRSVAAFVACGAAACWALRRPPRGLAADRLVVAAAVAGYLAWARAIGGWVPDLAFWPLLGLAAAGGLWAAGRLEGPARPALRAVSWLAAAVAALPVGDAVAEVVVAAGSDVEPWRGDPAALIEVRASLAPDPAWLSLFAGSAVLVVAGWADRWVWSPRRRAAAWVLAALTGLALPALVGVTMGAAVAWALATAVVFAAAASWFDDVDPRPGAAASVAGLVLAAAWAAPDVGLLLAPATVAVGLGVAGAVLGVRRNVPEVACVGVAVAVGALVADAGLLALRSDATAPWAWAVASATGAVVAALVPWIGTVLAGAPDRVGDGDRDGAPGEPSGGPSLAQVVARVGGSAAVALHLACLAGVFAAAEDEAGLVGPATLALLVGALALAVLAAGPAPAEARWWSAGLGAAELVALVWLRLAEHDVTAPEAYTLPVALVLALAGWAASRGQPGGVRGVASWRLEGPTLAMALGPTALVALGDPGLTRQLVGLGLGALVLALGAATRRRAPVDVGAAVLVVVGLQALLPYADDVPRWLSLGVAGALLVALGATFEERRRDLGQARRRYAALR